MFRAVQGTDIFITGTFASDASTPFRLDALRLRGEGDVFVAKLTNAGTSAN
jgi:hypothetical protein